jgi:hypothetical protein
MLALGRLLCVEIGVTLGKDIETSARRSIAIFESQESWRPGSQVLCVLDIVEKSLSSIDIRSAEIDRCIAASRSEIEVAQTPQDFSDD